MLYIKAPETLIAGELGCESDMWQLDLLCYWLMTSENLFTGLIEYQVMSAIHAGYDQKLEDLREEYPISVSLARALIVED